MIILTKELVETKDELTQIIEKEEILINSILANQKKLKGILLGYMQNLVVSTENISESYAKSVLDILNNIKNSLNIFKTNMDLLNNLLNLLNSLSIESSNKEEIIKNIENFNNSFLTDTTTVFQNTLEIENVLYSILPYSSLVFSKSGLTQTEEIADESVLENNVVSSSNIANNELESAQSSCCTDVSSENNAFAVENTLIISETKGKVFLPYNITFVNALLKNNPDKYTCIEDVVNREYSIPIDSFKNPSLSRFREGFKLMRKKEKKSIIEAFDLGMELTFKYNLHPAIICACNSLDELDQYLDYLDNKKGRSFDCFKIIFDIPPIAK